MASKLNYNAMLGGMILKEKNLSLRGEPFLKRDLFAFLETTLEKKILY